MDKRWLSKAAHYTLKCITKEQAEYVIKDIHKGICENHFRSRTMTIRIFRAGYFWPTMETGCYNFVKKCMPCQKHDNLIHKR